jgi:secreted Zn-dependent insulinase-like peptidase
VIDAVFSYAQKLKELGPQKYIYEEMNQMGEINFRFAEKVDVEDLVVELSSELQRYDASNISGILKNSFV